jgi:hypothetical protein
VTEPVEPVGVEPKVDFRLSARWDFPDYAPIPETYFDTYWRLAGIVLAELTDAELKVYKDDRAAFVKTCRSLMNSLAKRERLVRRDAAADRWAVREMAAGRHPWGVSPPESVFAARPRESARRPRPSRRTRAGNLRGPPGRSDDDPPDEADSDPVAARRVRQFGVPGEPGAPVCPRCGAQAQPRRNSAVWICVPCFRRLEDDWLAREVSHVLAEAEAIARRAAG